MSKEDKSVKENSLDEKLSLNGSGEDFDVSDDSQDEVENVGTPTSVSYTHLRAHETPEHLV